MTEIEKIQRYIKRTNMKLSSSTSYAVDMREAFELAHKVRGNNLPIDVISLDSTMAAPKATGRRKRRCGYERTEGSRLPRQAGH